MRVAEIRAALDQVEEATRIPAVCVVPVRMQEAWLLLDEPAIRYAAGNPNGRVGLQLPSVRKLEQLPDPKAILYHLLRTASELRGRRRRNFSVTASAVRITGFIRDFSPLRALSAFLALEHELDQVIEAQGWREAPDE